MIKTIKYIVLFILALCYTGTAMMSKEQVLSRVHMVESSSGKTALPMYPHKDGKSHGEYAITLIALKDVNDVYGTSFTLLDLRDPIKSRDIAGKYLTIMKKRFKCRTWLEAAGYYHSPSNPKKRVRYIIRLVKAGRQ